MKPTRVIKPKAAPLTSPQGAQKVRVGRTVSGIPGFFTGNMLAFSLSEDEFLDTENHATLASRYGFVLEA